MTQLSLFGEALDIAIRQAAHVAADDQRFQRPSADHRFGISDHPTDEKFSGVAHLRHGNADAFSSLDPFRPCPIA